MEICEPSGITTEEVESHTTRLLANVNIRMLVLGNLYKDVCARCMTPFHVN